MQRLWDKARANRPTIYERPNEPMISRFQVHDNGPMPIREFEKFFNELLIKAKPEHPIDPYELRRLLSIAGCQHFPIHFEKENNSLFSQVFTGGIRGFAGMLLAYDLLFRYYNNDAIAVQMLINKLYEVTIPDFLPFFPRFKKDDLISLLSFSSTLHAGREAAKKIYSDAEWIMSFTSFHVSHEPSSLFTCTLPVSEKIINGLQEILEKMNADSSFRYPKFYPRLVAAIGETVNHSYLMFGGSLYHSESEHLL